MDLIEVFEITKDANYNIELIAICILVLVVLFLVCAFISYKLQIYHPIAQTEECNYKKKRNK